jgi:cullin-4
VTSALTIWSFHSDGYEIEYDPEFGVGDHMFTDLALSREGMGEYHEKSTMNSLGQKLSVMVLQRSVWPFGVLRKSLDLPLAVSH